jgi:hypothetical protein
MKAGCLKLDISDVLLLNEIICATPGIETKVLLGSDAGKCSEVANEMRLIAIPRLQTDLR